MSAGSHGIAPEQVRESRLVLEDGSVVPGRACDFPASASGEELDDLQVKSRMDDRRGAAR